MERKPVKINIMNTHALLNVNSLLTMIDEDRVSELRTHLESLLQESQRPNVLGDQEMLQATSAIVHDMSVTPKSPLTDKMTRIFWNRTAEILRKHEVI